MIVVTDASPVMNLAIVDKLELLPAIFGKVLAPPAVFAELSLREPSMPGASKIRNVSWLDIVEVSDLSLVKALRFNLDHGEAEAIALAIQENATLLLIDERKARKLAAKMDLPILGLLGVLIIARQRELISEVKPLVDRLINEANFYVSTALYERVLREAGEL